MAWFKIVVLVHSKEDCTDAHIFSARSRVFSVSRFWISRPASCSCSWTIQASTYSVGDALLGIAAAVAASKLA
jgi:hypothetical protein